MSRLILCLCFILYVHTAFAQEADEDRNGLWDAWEQTHFGSLGNNRYADEDGDGCNERLEMLAGTDPKSGASRFHLEWERTESGLRSHFGPLIEGRIYELQRSSDLSHADSWETVASGDRAALGEWGSLEDEEATHGAHFYRIRVRSPGALGDVLPPSQVSRLRVEQPAPFMVFLYWDAASDDTAVGAYEVYRNGQLVGKVSDACFMDTEVEGGERYEYSVYAVDEASNRSRESLRLVVSTGEPENLVRNGDFSSVSLGDNWTTRPVEIEGWNSSEGQFELWDGAAHDAPFPTGTHHLELLARGIGERPFTVSTDPMTLSSFVEGNELKVSFDYWERGASSYATFNLMVNGELWLDEDLVLESSTDVVSHFEWSTEGLHAGDEISLMFFESGTGLGYHIANVSAFIEGNQLPANPTILGAGYFTVGLDQLPYELDVHVIPNAAGELSFAWTQVDGPSAAGLSHETIPQLVLESLESGEYTFRLTVSHGEGEFESRDFYVGVVPGDPEGMVYYVDAVNGDDETGVGSPGLPFASYDKVKSVMKAGDKALFQDGNYGDIVEGIREEQGVLYPENHFKGWATMAAAPGATPHFNSLTIGSQAEHFKSGGSSNPEAQGLAEIYIRYEGLVFDDGVAIYGSRYVLIKDCTIHRAWPLNGSIEAISRSGVGARYSRDFRIEGCDITEVPVGIGVGRNSSNVEIVGNHIHRIAHDGIQIVSVKGVLIEGNRIHNLDDGVGDDEGADWNRHCDGIHMYPEQGSHEIFRNEDITIRGNYIYDCESMGMMVNGKGGLFHRNVLIENNVWGTVGAIAVHLAAESFEGLVFRNNSQVYVPDRHYQSLYREQVIDGTIVQMPYWITEKMYGLEVYNNIFATWPALGTESFLRFKNNAFYNAEGYRSYGLDAGSIVLEENPFADPDAMDGVLKENSVLIDQGTRVSADGLEYMSGMIDILGRERDARPDMGAVETPGREPDAEALAVPAAQAPRFFVDDFEDLNYRTRDPFLNDVDTLGMAWYRPEGGDSAYGVKYDSGVKDSNVVMGSLNTVDGVLVSVDVFSDMHARVEATRIASNRDSGLVVLYQDDQNHYRIDLLEGDVLRYMGGEQTVIGDVTESLMTSDVPTLVEVSVEHLDDRIRFRVQYGDGEAVVIEDSDADAVALFDSGSFGFFKATDERYLRMCFDDVLIDSMP